MAYFRHVAKDIEPGVTATQFSGFRGGVLLYGRFGGKSGRQALAREEEPATC